MRYEIDLIKRKAKTVINKNNKECYRLIDQETKAFLIDIVKLADACLNELNDIDTHLTDICLGIRRVTTDIE